MTLYMSQNTCIQYTSDLSNQKRKNPRELKRCITKHIYINKYVKMFSTSSGQFKLDLQCVTAARRAQMKEPITRILIPSVITTGQPFRKTKAEHMQNPEPSNSITKHIFKNMSIYIPQEACISMFISPLFLKYQTGNHLNGY